MERKPINKLLARQIKRKLGKDVNLSAEMWDLLYAINDSYDHFARDRKLIERAMEKSSEELRISFEKLLLQNELERKNTELQQFVSMASHDLKAPLRTINSFATLLEKELGNDLSENAQEFLNFIMDGAKGMDALIHNLLNYARGSVKSNKADLIDIGHILEVVQKNCFSIINEKNAKIIIENKMPQIISNPFQIMQLFQNLISNAIKFQKKNVEPEIRINVVEKDMNYLFSIRDNGIGISKADQERVFGVFQRLKSGYEGNGLGLSICKKIVNLLNGEIWVESELDLGTTFYFTIPIPKQEIKPEQRSDTNFQAAQQF